MVSVRQADRKGRLLPWSTRPCPESRHVSERADASSGRGGHLLDGSLSRCRSGVNGDGARDLRQNLRVRRRAVRQGQQPPGRIEITHAQRCQGVGVGAALAHAASFHVPIDRQGHRALETAAANRAAGGPIPVNTLYATPTRASPAASNASLLATRADDVRAVRCTTRRWKGRAASCFAAGTRGRSPCMPLSPSVVATAAGHHGAATPCLQ
jgi:hypothetical protein